MKSKMEMKPVTAVKSQGEARQIAIDWQYWQRTQFLSYGEVSAWQGDFIKLGKKFSLKREFKENGII